MVSELSQSLEISLEGSINNDPPPSYTPTSYDELLAKKVAHLTGLVYNIDLDKFNSLHPKIITLGDTGSTAELYTLVEKFDGKKSIDQRYFTGCL